MPVFVGSNQIIPAPFFTYPKQILVAGDQRRIGNTYVITMTGKLVAWKGSPQQGSLVGPSWGGYQNLFWTNTGYPPDETVQFNARIHALEVKEEALRNLFSVDGQWVEFESYDGAVSFKCQLKNAQIDFGLDDIYFNIRPYTIQFETDIVYVNGSTDDSNPDSNDYIQNCSEVWDVQEGDVVKTFKLTHTVSAVGKRMFDSLGNQVGDSWQHAQNFVNQQLVLGYNGYSSFSQNPANLLFQNSALSSGVINIDGLSPYNFARTEQIDELGGSYSVTESWTLSANSGAEVYNINIRKISNDPYTSVNASIQGSIKGFYVNLFDYDQRLKAAQWQWDQVRPTLFNRVSSYASGVNLNVQPVQAATDQDYNGGSLSYNYDFSNTLFEGDAFESYTVNRQDSADSYRSQFNIQGTIRGRRYDGDIDSTVYLRRAQAWWNQVRSTGVLYNRIISSKYFPEASGLGLQIAPMNFQIDTNEAEGVISYSYQFDNRKNDGDVSDNNVIDEYSITNSFNRNDGVSSYTIAGTVKGLNVDNDNVPDQRQAAFANASGYYYGSVLPNLYGRITGLFHITLADTNPYTRETVFNIPQATISYQAQFFNYPLPLISGVLSEMISVSEDNYLGNVQLIASIPIPGRSLGPILQDVKTTSAKMRRLSIETIVGPTGGKDFLSSFNLKPDYSNYVIQLLPVGGYIEADSDDWNWRLGRYTRNTSWIYE